MFRIHTESGSVYTFDTENKRVIRQNPNVPLAMVPSSRMDDVTGNWRTYDRWFVDPEWETLRIYFPNNDYVYSTKVLRMENLTSVG